MHILRQVSTIVVAIISFADLSYSYTCSGFNDDWFTTNDGCPVIRKSKALAKTSDSTSMRCTYSAVIGSISYLQYDSAQSFVETSVLKKYGRYLPDASSKFNECVWKDDLESGKLLNRCVNSLKRDSGGLKWCKCQYDAVKNLNIPFSRYDEMVDENSGLYGHIANCFVTGEPVQSQTITYDSSKIVIPAYRTGKVMKINVPISDYSYSFLFDTGADRILINKKVYRRLLEGNNAEPDSVKFGKFEIATGKIVTLQLLRIKTIVIGDAIINDIPAAIQNDSTASMLFGMSAISKFKSWTMHENPLQIIFHK